MAIHHGHTGTCRVALDYVLARYGCGGCFPRIGDYTCPVPPDRFRDPDGTGWYEQGELKEWHRWRKLKLQFTQKRTRAFERARHVRPSYDPSEPDDGYLD